jgi:hypothetical protein
MRKFLPLLLCLSLTIFTVARATKLAHVFAPETDAKALVNDANTEEEAGSDDDDNTTGAPDDEGEDVNGDHGDGVAGDEGTAPDDEGEDDGDDDGSGDQGE